MGDTLIGMLVNVIIGVVPKIIGVKPVADTNVDVLKAAMTVLVFVLLASSEESFLSCCCTPCSFWPRTALGSDRVLQAWMPLYHV